jgi:hypothetical protein
MAHAKSQILENCKEDKKEECKNMSDSQLLDDNPHRVIDTYPKSLQKIVGQGV